MPIDSDDPANELNGQSPEDATDQLPEVHEKLRELARAIGRQLAREAFKTNRRTTSDP